MLRLLPIDIFGKQMIMTTIKDTDLKTLKQKGTLHRLCHCSWQCLGHQIGTILGTSNECDRHHTFAGRILLKKLFDYRCLNLLNNPDISVTFRAAIEYVSKFGPGNSSTWQPKTCATACWIPIVSFAPSNKSSLKDRLHSAAIHCWSCYRNHKRR